MCLSVGHNLVLVATEDITCYKIVVCDDKGRWCTAYKHTQLSEEQLSGKKPFYADGVFVNNIFITIDRKVEGGAIHTFFDVKDAAYHAEHKNFPDFGVYEGHVYRCIIPKGTIYIEGFYGGDKSYASKEIIFKEKIF